MTTRAATSAIVAVAIVAYVTAFWGAYQFDDYKVIVDYQPLHSWSGYLADLGGLRPLTKLVTVANWTSELGLPGFHATNLAIHVATAVLAYRLCARIAGATPALLAALVFAAHPINTEAVTYISGRATSLAALLALASVLAYVRGRDTTSRVWLYGISPVLYALAFFAKETAIVVPLLIALVELVQPTPGALKRLGAHAAVLAALGVVVLAHPAYRHSLDYSLGIRGLGDSLRADVAGTWYLLGKLAWPVELNIDPALAVPPLDVALVAKALALCAVAGVAIANVRKRAWLAFGIGWFVIALLPVMSIVPRRDVVNEREVYLASIGLVLVACVIACNLAVYLPALLRKLVAVAAVGAFVMLALVRNYDYRSEIALWQSSLRAKPDNARALNNLGWAYLLARDYAEAELAFEGALFVRPDYTLARVNLDILNNTRAQNEH